MVTNTVAIFFVLAFSVIVSLWLEKRFKTFKKLGAGAIAILIPGLNRLKEWAYAGLFFDLFGAAYSGIAVGGFQPSILFMLLPLGFLFLSYFLWHKMIKQQGK